jgi:hypothetical protein
MPTIFISHLPILPQIEKQLLYNNLANRRVSAFRRNGTLTMLAVLAASWVLVLGPLCRLILAGRLGILLRAP